MEKAITTQQTGMMDPRSTLALAIEKGMDPVTLGKLMDLQDRWDATQARKAYVEALAGFKRECPAVIGKDKRADFGAGKAKYSYATTGAIVTAITPAMSKFGLSLSWETKQEPRLVTVTCHVTHSAGHRESATLTGPHDESGGKNPIQTLGSSVHYLQRYTMVSVLGLATADMDDPDAAPPRPPVSMPTAKPDAPTDPEASLAGCEVVTGIVESVSTKPAPKGGKRYGIKVGGVWYNTFSDTLGTRAEALKLSGEAALLHFVTTDKGFHDLEAIDQAPAMGDSDGLSDADKDFLDGK
mgnify:CR=1 FL=1